MLEITWLGHSTFQFRLESGEVFVADPWLENPSFPKGYALERVDAVLVSHGHFDHIHDVRSLARQHKPKVVGIYETCQWLGSKNVENLAPMNKGGSQQVGPVRVTMTHAVHSCGITDDDGTIVYGGEACGYVLRFPDGRSIYFAGDTNVFSDMQLIEQLYHPDLALLPVGDLFTMGPQEAALAVCMLKPKKTIPMHFGTFPALTGTPAEFRKLAGERTEVWELTPGKPVTW